jgi:phosphatidylglycerophosphate synthase
MEALMDHIREHRSLLAAGEKRLLTAIARRLPWWISSDALTVTAFAALAAAGGAFAALPRTRWAAVAFTAALVVNWFGDSLDGTLARVRGQPRPRYGYYVDHVVDLAGTTMLVGGMAASGWMHAAMAAALLAAYVLVAAETYLATHAAGIFRLSFAGVGPTELRIVLAVGACYVTAHPWIDLAGRRVLLLDVGAAVAIGGLAFAFVVSALRTTRALYRAEPLPRRGERAA